MQFTVFLLCEPVEALARLLSIGELLCASTKDGTIGFAMDVWGDTARDRRWRDEILSNPSVILAAMDHTDATAAMRALEADVVYYTSRPRRDLYAIKAIDAPHPMYILQVGVPPHTHSNTHCECRVVFLCSAKPCVSAS
jgi:hypothetical protein